MLNIVGIVAFCAVISSCGDSRTPNAVDDSSAPTIENLRKVLQDVELRERDPDRVMNAIQSLARRGAVEAVPDLISLLGFRYWYSWERKRGGGPRLLRPIGVSSRYPATAALFTIGKPALPPLLQVVESREFNSIESKNARYTIRAIFRDNPSKAAEFFKDAATRATTREAKERLLRALETAEEDMKLGNEDM